MNRTLLTKLTSRKFLMAFIPAIVAIFTMLGYHENTVMVIASAAVIIISTIGYNIVEGKCDVAGITAALTEVTALMETLKTENAELKETNDMMADMLIDQTQDVEDTADAEVNSDGIEDC